MHQQPILPTELIVLHFLQKRMRLPDKSWRIYNNLYKGYLGERKFFRLLMEWLPRDCGLYSLFLEGNDGSAFQIDCLILLRDEIYLIEVKNFEGEYYFQNKNFYLRDSNREIKNPLIQLSRSTFSLKDLLSNYGFKYPVHSYIVFVNDSFTLFQSPMNLSITLPTQLKSFIRKLNNTPVHLTANHRKLMKTLCQLHIKESKHDRIPSYDFGNLRKGIICRDCNSLMKLRSGRKLRCNNCSYVESVDSAIMRTVVEFSVLFPERPIQTNVIHEWCGGIVSKKIIRRVLTQYMKLIRKSSQSHYLFLSR